MRVGLCFNCGRIYFLDMDNICSKCHLEEEDEALDREEQSRISREIEEKID